ncbi:MAG TPA: citrate transporter [Firmicutes bacterium]|nr:citrate transporter [Bacillota bacterium]
MCKLVKKCVSFFTKEAVLCISVILALLSCLFVPPSVAYISYIDWDTLALLFSLMAVMKGLQKANFFVCLANLLLKKIVTTRTMLFILVFLPFIFSMVITNDVALIAFVPFGLTILQIAGQERLMVPQVVLQTIAANLGSMLTPMGNPQNLYLYNRSGIEFGEFCGLMLPYVLAAAVCLVLAIVLIKPVRISGISLSAELGSPKALLCYSTGFVLCLLGVFKVLSPVVIAAVTILVLLFTDRKLLASIDYSLLGTFFAFFIFVGNVAGIEGFQNFLASVLKGRVVVVSILASQIISNVPACLLLSGFTSQWESLIIGCNLGGLGTLIASMASLISYKMVVKEYPEQRKRYFRWFTLLNICFLIFLFLLYSLI